MLYYYAVYACFIIPGRRTEINNSHETKCVRKDNYVFILDVPTHLIPILYYIILYVVIQTDLPPSQLPLLPQVIRLIFHRLMTYILCVCVVSTNLYRSYIRYNI